MSASPLRVALLAGTLERGGAEKQLVYMADALRQSGVDVRLHTLRGGPHEASLRRLGIEPIPVSRHESPVLRLLAFASAARSFRPHVVQSAHFYANLYAALAAPACGALGIGAIRGDPAAAMRANGRWGTPLLRTPRVLFANSEAARRAAVAKGVPARAIHVVPNVIALGPLPHRSTSHGSGTNVTLTVLLIGSLRPAKRVDRFLGALAVARRRHPSLVGRIVGDGPERAALEQRAAQLGLAPPAVEFIGQLPDVRPELARAQILVLASDHEGSPNVLLEAMEAGLPIVTTRAGDAGVLVRDGITGFVTGFDEAEMAERIADLASDPGLRARFGLAGRADVEAKYGVDRLAGWLLAAYGSAARAARIPRVLEVIST